MSAHTPGPWKVCDRAPNDSWFVGSTIFSEPWGKRVADVAGVIEGRTADAHLIAAAPDLLATTHDLLKMVEAAHRQLGMYAAGNPRLQKARLAIEKAEGRLPG